MTAQLCSWLLKRLIQHNKNVNFYNFKANFMDNFKNNIKDNIKEPIKDNINDKFMATLIDVGNISSDQ